MVHGVREMPVNKSARPSPDHFRFRTALPRVNIPRSKRRRFINGGYNTPEQVPPAKPFIFDSGRS